MSYDYVSPNISRLLGFSVEEMKKINFRSLILETRIVEDRFQTVDSFSQLEEARIKGHVDKWEADYLMRTKDGRKVWVNDVSYPWHDEDGKLLGSVGTLRDITQRVKAEEQAREMINTFTQKDILTGLANRKTLIQHIDHEFMSFASTHQHFSVLMLSIDHFKHIHDSHDYTVSDLILSEVASLIRSSLRKDDIAARLEGNQFAILLPNTKENEAYWVSERITQLIHRFSFAEEYLTQGIHCTVSISIISSECPDAINTSMLLQQADMRLYVAQSTGVGQVCADSPAVVH
jgi:diguanylate cyclase (GGDEF)-like protein/PAS domain S-box-containing protein